jgi:hypothetical protein
MVWDELDRRVKEKQQTNAQHTLPVKGFRTPIHSRVFILTIILQWPGKVIYLHLLNPHEEKRKPISALF